MLRAFSTAATGMAANQMTVDVIANNLANVNTSGFKRFQMDFQDLMYVRLLDPGREIASGVNAPNGLEIGSGVRPAATIKVFSQGEMENTERPLDVSIQGDGFFEITLPDGSTRYTRAGSFSLTSTGLIVTSSGNTVAPGITVPTNAKSISIGQDGTVSATIDGNPPTTSTLGTLTLARFPNPAGLANEGGSLFVQTAASGDPTTSLGGQNGMGILQQGFLEKSNVQMVTELVSLITAQRAYEINSKCIRVGDDMLSAANRLVQ